MLIDTRSDHHIHTRLCHHALGEMEEYVLAAINNGLNSITFLEHMEAGVNYFEVTWLAEQDFDDYFAEGRRLQEEYKNQIIIKLGIEVGSSLTHKDDILARLKNRQWDEVGLSYHFAQYPQFEHHLNLVSRKEPNTTNIETIGSEQVLEHYFTSLIEAVKTFPGTMLCHLDAALRYQKKISLTKNHLQLIEELLQQVKEQEMSLEINTSGFAMRGEPFPARDIVKKALELNIPLVASSDAHKPEDVGRYFDRLPNYLATCLPD